MGLRETLSKINPLNKSMEIIKKQTAAMKKAAAIGSDPQAAYDAKIERMNANNPYFEKTKVVSEPDASTKRLPMMNTPTGSLIKKNF